MIQGRMNRLDQRLLYLIRPIQFGEAKQGESTERTRFPIRVADRFG